VNRAKAIAAVLAAHGFPEPDAIRHHDMDAAADLKGVARPTGRDERADILDAYAKLTEGE
jgi:hypothetical protein